jgi:hypothetical protein
LASRRLLTCGILFILIRLGPARAGNIFDDIESLPVRPPTVAPTVAPAKPATQAITPDARPTGVGRPEDSPGQVPATAPTVPSGIWPSEVAAVPSVTEQAKARALFKEIFARELKERSPSARRSLAQQLLAEAVKLGADASPDRYVLLAAARQAAIEASDLKLAMQAVESLAASYAIDGPRVKLDTAMKAIAKGESAAANAENCRSGMHVLDELIAANAYAQAVRLAAALQPLAASDPVYAIVAQRKARDVDALRSAYDHVTRESDRLVAAPNDPAANAAVGSFLCFFKGAWADGLPMLAKGPDGAARKLAQAELGRPSQSSALQELADGWWALGEKQAEVQRTRIREHAATIYQRIVGDVAGLRRTAIEKRMADAAKAAGPRLIDLLAIADPASDAVHGHWAQGNDGALTSSEQQGTRLELPYRPPEEYMFRVEFTHATLQTVCVSVSKGERGLFFVMGGNNNSRTGFERVRGELLASSPATVKLPLQLAHRYVCIVEVRNDRVRAYLDGRSVIDWKTDYRDLAYVDVNAGWISRDPPRLGIGSYDTSATFHRIEVLELTGEGQLLK